MNYLIKIDLIKFYIKENNLSKTSFCNQCRIGTKTLSNIFASKEVKLTALLKIARLMNVGLCELIVSSN